MTDPGPPDAPALDDLAEFQAWKKVNPPGFSLLSYLYGVAKIETAVAFTALFWPDLLEHRGGVFLAEGFDARVFEEWRARLGGDLPGIERVMNHRHVGDLLPGADGVGERNLLYLGRVLAELWECRLARRFPGRRFEVTCERDGPEVVVGFCQAQ